MQVRPRPMELVAQLAADGVEIFTLGELRDRYGLTDKQAHALAYRLARQKLVHRVKRGVYAIAPTADRAGGHPATLNWYWAAAQAIGDEPYFLAYYTAMELNQMLQHPLRTVFVAVRRYHRELHIGPARIRYVPLVENKFFGAEERLIEGHPLKVAGLERTFIDAVDRPELCGGIEEVFRGIGRKHRDIDPDRLLRLAYRFDRPTAAKRLGFLLEAAGFGEPEVLWELERLGARLKRFIPLDKTRPADGPRTRRWGLILNVETQRLLKAAKT